MSCVTPAPASRGRRVDGVGYTKRTFENSSVSWPVPRILRSGARARVGPPVDAGSAASAHGTDECLLLARRSGASLLDVGRHRCALRFAERVAHARSAGRQRALTGLHAGCRLAGAAAARATRETSALRQAQNALPQSSQLRLERSSIAAALDASQQWRHHRRAKASGRAA